MASCDWNEIDTSQEQNQVSAWFRRIGRWFNDWRALAAIRRQQRQDREAFLNLLGREEWMYRDMGIHKADVEWAAHLPMHINAARELEALRSRNMQGR